MQKIVIKSYETKKTILMPIILLVIGIIMFVNPGEIGEFISYIIGGIFLALGIGKFISDTKRNDRTTGDSFYSAVMVVLGLIFIFFSGTIEFIMRLSIGLWIIINSLNTIAIGSNLIRIEKNSLVTLLIGIILLLLGLYTIFVSNLVFSMLGLILIIYSVLEIVDYIYIQIKSR